MSSYESQSQVATNEGFANHPHNSEEFGQPEPSDLLNSVKVRAAKVLGGFESSVRANPWLSVGIAGAGALAVGYLVGRGFLKDQSVQPPTEVEDVPSGYDE